MIIIIMISDYNIIPLYSNGSLSTIYKGTHKTKNKNVIVKFSYDDITKKLIENEIRIYIYLKKKKYSYIPNIINIGIYKGNQYIITEYKNKPLTYVNKDIINQLFDIINALHKNKIIHRDIKPDNFLIEKNNIFIIDFGLSTFYSDTHQLKKMIGNWKYCSYRCLNHCYKYEYKDDIISIIYMILHLHNRKLPWNKETYLNKEKIKLETFYDTQDPINHYLIHVYNHIHHFNYSLLHLP